MPGSISNEKSQSVVMTREAMSKDMQQGRWKSLGPVQTEPLQATRRGPRGALKEVGLDRLNQEEKMIWLENARLRALLGSSRSSHASLKSGLRCYFGFMGPVHYVFGTYHDACCM